MSKKTINRCSSQPLLAVYNKSGLLLATSYKALESGQIEFWTFRDSRVFSMPIALFETTYITKEIR